MSARLVEAYVNVFTHQIRSLRNGGHNKLCTYKGCFQVFVKLVFIPNSRYLQKASFHIAEGCLLPCRRMPFTMRLDGFYNTRCAIYINIPNLTPVRYKKNVIILKTNGTILNRKKSVAYRHSGLRPGIQETSFCE